MKKYIINLISLSFIFMLFYACDDDPTSIGDSLIPDEDKINVKSINSLDGDFPQFSSSYREPINLSFSNRTLLGFNDGIEYFSLMKIGFSLSDSVETAIDNGTLVINKVWMELPIDYRLGDESSEFDFTLHEISSSWTSIDFDEDSLNNLTHNSEDISSNRIINDSLITFDLEKNIVQKWLEFTVDEETSNNKGILFDVTENTDKAVGIPALSTSATIENSSKLYAIVEVPGEFVDTISGQSISDVHVPVVKSSTKKEDTDINQAALTMRSNVWIDISQIPENAIINNAELKIFIDEEESNIGTLGSDSIFVHSYADSLNKDLDTASISVIIKNENYYEGSINRVIQTIIDKNENQGLSLRLSNERDTGNKVAFYNSEAEDKKLRPLLTVIYTIKN